MTWSSPNQQTNQFWADRASLFQCYLVERSCCRTALAGHQTANLAPAVPSVRATQTSNFHCKMMWIPECPALVARATIPNQTADRFKIDFWSHSDQTIYDSFDFIRRCTGFAAPSNKPPRLEFTVLSSAVLSVSQQIWAALGGRLTSRSVGHRFRMLEPVLLFHLLRQLHDPVLLARGGYPIQRLRPHDQVLQVRGGSLTN